tara:strand:- start:18 stop:188 length:171 start_codon:yes stop_codon:yes gene_type:complete
MKIKDAVQDWLDEHGYALGYNWDSLPQLSEFQEIATLQVRRDTYDKHFRGEERFDK